MNRPLLLTRSASSTPDSCRFVGEDVAAAGGAAGKSVPEVEDGSASIPASRYAFNFASVSKLASWRSAARHEAGRVSWIAFAPSMLVPTAISLEKLLRNVRSASPWKSNESLPTLRVEGNW